MEKEYRTRTLDDLLGSLRNAEGKALVLIGAGCSVSAGIPLGSGVVQEIQKKYAQDYARAERRKMPVDYNTAMAEVSPKERRKLLNGIIGKAKVNWAHLALAQLLKCNHIDRVLTVNFDPLLIQACSLADHYPAVYDLTTIDQYDEKKVVTNSILYLNGQHTGFVMLNDEVELKEHETRLRQVVSGIGTNVIWIVAGYSGDADPLRKVLAEQRRFDADLYWLGFDEKPSDALMQSGLLDEGRRAFYVPSQNADLALTTLAQKLDCFPPDILKKPIQFIQSLIERIKPESGGPQVEAIMDEIRQRLERATKEDRSALANAGTQMLAGQYHSVIQWIEELRTTSHPAQEELKLGTWAYVNEGNSLVTDAQALRHQGNFAAAQSMLEQTGSRYVRALAINPNMYEAIYFWGNAFDAEAQAFNDMGLRVHAYSKWAEASEKYAQALEIKPEYHLAAYSWAEALEHEAQACEQQSNFEGAQAKRAQARELLAKHPPKADPA